LGRTIDLEEIIGMRTNHRLLALGIGLTAILAACSGSGASAAPSAAAPSAEASAPAPAAAATVALADSALGKILVDSEGKTLYMFTKDEGGTPTCYDDCAANWPALVVTGDATAGDGVTAALTTVARTDGGAQVKAGEYPLYYFAADAAAGDTNGQGIGGFWYVVGADGEPIK
jgi:predicted lipoprotein with Yx(FWY)xxD motif